MILVLSTFDTKKLQGFLVQLIKDWPTPAGFYSREATRTFLQTVNKFHSDPEATVIFDSNRKANKVSSSELKLKTAIKSALKSYPERYQNSVEIFCLAGDATSETQIDWYCTLPKWISIVEQKNSGEVYSINARGSELKNHWTCFQTQNTERLALVPFFRNVDVSVEALLIPALRSQALNSFREYRIFDLIVDSVHRKIFHSQCLQVKKLENSAHEVRQFGT